MNQRDLEKRLKQAEGRLAAAAERERERAGGGGGSLARYRAELGAIAADLGWTVDWDADDAPMPPASLDTAADVRAFWYAQLAAHARRPTSEEEQGEGDDDAQGA